jgi:hypothetical protein
LRDKYKFEINEGHWKRAQKHYKKYGCGELVPSPTLPPSKQVSNKLIYFF